MSPQGKLSSDASELTSACPTDSTWMQAVYGYLYPKGLHDKVWRHAMQPAPRGASPPVGCLLPASRLITSSAAYTARPIAGSRPAADNQRRSRRCIVLCRELCSAGITWLHGACRASAVKGAQRSLKLYAFAVHPQYQGDTIDK